MPAAPTSSGAGTPTARRRGPGEDQGEAPASGPPRRCRWRGGGKGHRARLGTSSSVRSRTSVRDAGVARFGRWATARSQVAWPCRSIIAALHSARRWCAGPAAAGLQRVEKASDWLPTSPRVRQQPPRSGSRRHREVPRQRLGAGDASPPCGARVDRRRLGRVKEREAEGVERVEEGQQSPGRIAAWKSVPTETTAGLPR